MKKTVLALIGLALITTTLYAVGSQTDTLTISVYFNKQGDDFRQIIEDTINKTEGDVLIAMYDFTQKSGLAEFIRNIAKERSVKIVFDQGGHDDAYEIVKSASNVQIRYVTNLHHKFVVIGNQVVITGSANWSDTSFKKDANNLVVIYSEKIAQAYEEEFYKEFNSAKAYYGDSTATLLPAPTLLSPPDGATFDHYPRTTTFTWTIVPGAAHYKIFVDYAWYDDDGKLVWQSTVGKSFDYSLCPGFMTDMPSYTMDFYGAQPGRWQVWAVDVNGNCGAGSGWRYFKYLK